jgi:hypothetical protein
MKLVQNMLRPLDGARHQLRVKHHIQCINAEMFLRFLITTIYLDGIAHGLEGMERKTDRQNDLQ